MITASRPSLRNLSAAAICTAFSLVLAPAAAAAESEQQGFITDFNLLNYIVGVVVFLIVIAVLKVVVWPKIIAGLDEREAKILGEIERAEEARAQAEKAQAEYTQELAQAKAEAQQMIEQTKAEQTRLAAELKATAEAELTAMRDSARQQIESAKQAAITEIYQEAGTLATAVAAKILQREVNEADTERLVQETLSEITKEYAGQA